MLSLLMVRGSGPPDGPGGLVANAVRLDLQLLALRSLRDARAATVQGLGVYPLIV